MEKPPHRPVHTTRPSRRRYVFALALTVLLGLSLAFVALTLYFGRPQAPFPSLVGPDRHFNPEQPLLIDFTPLRFTPTNATLYEVPPGDLYSNRRQSIPVALTPDPIPSVSAPSDSASKSLESSLLKSSDSTLWEWETRRVRVTRPDGGNPLRPDAAYCLELAGDWGPLSLAWLKSGRWNEEYCFATEASPKLVSPVGPVYLNSDQPVAIEWDMPVVGFSYRVTPSVPTSYTLDIVDSRRAYVTMQDYIPGQRYDIEVLDAVGINGIALQRSDSFSVIMPKPPSPRVLSSTSLRFGDKILLAWDEPIVSFDYSIDPPEQSSAVVDPADHRRSAISLQSLAQGQEYQITITEALAKNGLRLAQPFTFTVETPVALEVVETTPGDGAFGVDPNQSVCVAFDEVIADRSATERSLVISQAVEGIFEWVSEREVCFVHDEPFAFGSDVNVRVSSGPDYARGRSGSYLASDVDFQLTVRPNKLIDVDLTRQTVRLFEGDALVMTTLTSTGVRGAETPVGTYMVQYKMKSTRMRGVTPSGSRYDLPNVPWVLAFWGDYTIHGAYWRNGFGFPQSNGCVSLPVPVAEKIFYWAPEGTPIKIHY